MIGTNGTLTTPIKIRTTIPFYTNIPSFSAVPLPTTPLAGIPTTSLTTFSIFSLGSKIGSPNDISFFIFIFYIRGVPNPL